MATTAPASAPAIKPAGPVWSQNLLNKAVNEVSPVAIREATLAEEAQLLPMMRKLAEQQPGAIKFDEPAVRVAFGRFLSVPAFGKVWLLCERSNQSAMSSWRWASALSSTATTHSSTSCTSRRPSGDAGMAVRQLPLSKKRPTRWA